MKQLFLFLITVFSMTSIAGTPDWSEGFAVPPGGRPNPYNLSPTEFEASRERGRLAATTYPVSVTAILLPFKPIYNFLEKQNPNPLFNIIQLLFKAFTEIKSFNSFLAWTGLHEYPKENETSLYKVPYPENTRPDYLMGLSFIERHGVKGFTIGCAACHSSQLFGKTILGLTNRFPRANRLFAKAKQASAFADLRMFQASTGANNAETLVMGETLKNLGAIESKLPQQLGLDTSLAQVALAMSHRDDGPWAEKNPAFEAHPRPEILDHEIYRRA